MTVHTHGSAASVSLYWLPLPNRKAITAMKVTLSTFMSIDGVMQSPSDPTEDPRNGFTLGGWLVPHRGGTA